MKKIIFIMGKTRSGKDSLAREMERSVGVIPIVSYTTRNKRANEEDGREHWFISKEKMAEIKRNEMLIGYTKNPKTGVEYCAVASHLDPDKWYSYIINPEGFRYFLSKLPEIGNNIYFNVIFVDCPENVLAKRGKERKEDEEIFLKRLESERFEFDYFKNNCKDLINLLIDSTDYSLGNISFKAHQCFKIVTTYYEDYITSYISRAYTVPKYEVSDKTLFLHKLHGKKTFEIVTIKDIINDRKRFEKVYYVLDQFPNTVISENDIDDKFHGFDFIRFILYPIKILYRKIFKN